MASRLDDVALSIKIDKVDGKLHSEGVDGLAGNNPEPLPRLESRTAEQTLPAPLTTVGNFDSIGNLNLAREIGYAQSDLCPARRLRQKWSEQPFDSRPQRGDMTFRVHCGPAAGAALVAEPPE
jgi:hypothetical protein